MNVLAKTTNKYNLVSGEYGFTEIIGAGYRMTNLAFLCFLGARSKATLDVFMLRNNLNTTLLLFSIFTYKNLVLKIY